MLLGFPHGPTPFPGTGGVSYRVDSTLTGVSGDSVRPHGYGRVPQDGPTADAGLGCPRASDPLATNRRFPQVPLDSGNLLEGLWGLRKPASVLGDGFITKDISRYRRKPAEKIRG